MFGTGGPESIAEYWGPQIYTLITAWGSWTGREISLGYSLSCSLQDVCSKVVNFEER